MDDIRNNNPTHTDLGIVAQRLANNEQAFNEFKVNTNNALQSISSQLTQTTTALQHQLQTMIASIENRMRPQWSVMTSIASVGLAFFVFFVITPIQRDIESIRKDLHQENQDRGNGIKELKDNTVSWREHQQLISDLRANQAQTVTRAEHEQQWAAQRANSEHLQSEIKRLDEQMSQIYNAGAALREMQQRIHELESQRNALIQQQH